MRSSLGPGGSQHGPDPVESKNEKGGVVPAGKHVFRVVGPTTRKVRGEKKMKPGPHRAYRSSNREKFKKG